MILYPAEIVPASARALFVCAYTVAAQKLASGLPRPGEGQEWDDVAPVTPEAAVDSARRMLGYVAALNRCPPDPSRDWTLGRIFRDWTAVADDPTTAERFGWLIAMECIGVRVGFSDSIWGRLRTPCWDAHYVDGVYFDTCSKERAPS